TIAGMATCLNPDGRKGLHISFSDSDWFCFPPSTGHVVPSSGKRACCPEFSLGKLPPGSLLIYSTNLDPIDPDRHRMFGTGIHLNNRREVGEPVIIVR